MTSKITAFKKAKISKSEKYFKKALAFTLGPVELKELAEKNNIKIIDVRDRADYEIAHIPQAISIPYMEILNRLNELNKEETTVVYCYNQQCHLGLRACLKLADYGYPCMHLDGGFKVWQEDFRFATETLQ